MRQLQGLPVDASEHSTHWGVCVLQPPNTRMHPTAFGAQDRCYLSVIVCGAPRRRVMRKPFGRSPSRLCSL